MKLIDDKRKQIFFYKYKLVLVMIFIVFFSSCATQPPKRPDNICKIFQEKSKWHKYAKKAQKKWGTSLSILMATIHQESKFVGTAKPPRTKILWIFPGPRPSSAYGYAQVLDGTWKYYKNKTNQYWIRRDSFKDAINFVAWYYRESYRRSKINRDDAYHLYLSYHEGHGGFNRRSFKKKSWLKNVAKKVSKRSATYAKQYASCEKRLNRPWWLPG